MKFSHNKSWKTFEKIFSKGYSPTDAWNQLIAYHQKQKTKPYWESLRKLDTAKEQEEIATWLNELVTKEPLPPSVKALWIGIALMYDEKNDREVYAYYVQGADSYKAGDIEWATEPTYDPEEKYFVPNGINELRSIIKEDEEDFSFLDWVLPLTYSSFLFDSMIRTQLKKELFKADQKLYVTIGFDGGDFKELATLQ